MMANGCGEKTKGRSLSGITQTARKRQCVESAAGSYSTSTVTVTTLNDHSVRSLYSPVARMPNKNDLQRALEEFARLENEQEVNGVPENERQVQVVLATGVNVRKWTNSALADTIKYVRFEALVEDGVTSNGINESTTCDVIIIKLVGEPHQAVVLEIGKQIGIYGDNQCNSVFGPCAGRRLFTINSAGGSSFREPDVTFTAGKPNAPTIIIEFEHKNRSLPKLNLWCRGYFHTPGVRQVIGIKMFGPNPNGEVAALAVQYGYNNTGQVDVLDAVSFGHRDVLAAWVPVSIWNRIRFLANPTPAQTRANLNPWVAGGANGFITVPFGECTFNSPVPLNTVGNDLQIDLFQILRLFCRHL